jgi:hypothetical protein
MSGTGRFAPAAIGYAPGMSRPKRIARTIVLSCSVALLAAGCGSEGKEIEDVKSCLAEVKLTVEDLPKDKDVTSGVFATTDLTKVEDEEFTFALAAHVKSDGAVKQFQDESKDFSKTAGADQKLDFETGVDGRYVWVAGGAKDTDDYKDARACVEP